MGEQQIEGVGILGKRRPPDNLIDLFSVTLNGTQLIVLPKEGKIMQNLATIFQGEPGTLIWFRTMQMEIGKRITPPRCIRYGIGIQNGERHGFHLFEDGTVEQGL